MGLEARGIANRSNPNDVSLTLTNRYERVEYYEMKMKKYVIRIDHNDRVISVMEQILAISKVFITIWAVLILVLAYTLLTQQSVGVHWLLLPSILSLFYARTLPMSYMETDFSTSSGPLYETQYRDYLEGSSEVGLTGILDLLWESISRKDVDPDQVDIDNEVDQKVDK
ncbi:hypothetical protein [Halorubrum tebenquichense]|uniref:hypothetical protein n=1 Tax=Halorubrum tebenquichense TaxID=119434 RepID=UPI00126853B3|nr:hypothetical protein [Halorubrum tebenquichense]